MIIYQTFRASLSWMLSSLLYTYLLYSFICMAFYFSIEFDALMPCNDTVSWIKGGRGCEGINFGSQEISLCKIWPFQAKSIELFLNSLGVQYYTGQKLDMESITRHAVDLGIPVGWDLAHAVGRIIYLLQFLHGGRGHWNIVISKVFSS